MLICYIIATYYAVVVAWAIAYTGYAATTAWGDDAVGFFVTNHLNLADTATGFTLDFSLPVLIPLVILWALAIFALGRGIRRGLDKANRITLPALVILFTVIVIYALFLPGALEGVNAFFTPSWAALADPAVWIAAYGHIFFSFSISFGIMLTYSSYLRRKSDLTGSGLVVAFSNTSFELLAGIGVFATLGFLASVQGVGIADLDSIQGVGLAFMTYPTLLAEMPGGAVIGVLFFLCLVLAGFTSLLSILQVVSAAVQDKTGWNARRAGVFVGVATAIPSMLLFATTSGLTTLDIVDAFVNNVGVVLSAIATLVLVVIVARKGPELAKHLNATSSFKVGMLWRVMVGIVTPVILAVIFVTGTLGYIENGYGGYPGGMVAVAGWGMLALLLAASFALSYRPYLRPPSAEDELHSMAELDALGVEVEAEKARMLAERRDGKVRG